MKKLFVVLATLLMGASTGFAQKYVQGEFVVLDEVPAFVLYVDDSGQHGVIMSIPAYGRGAMSGSFGSQIWTGKNSKKKEQEAFWASHPDWICKSFDWKSKKKDMKKDVADYAQALADLEEILGPDGEKNTRAIEGYCAEKGLNMDKLFPEVKWARSLGEGWYVAGDDEIEKFASYYADGINNKIHGTRWLFIAKDLSNDQFQMRYGLQAYATVGIQSTSLCRAKKGGGLVFQKLIVMQTKIGPWWFAWNDGVWSGDRNIAACRKF